MVKIVFLQMNLKLIGIFFLLGISFFGLGCESCQKKKIDTAPKDTTESADNQEIVPKGNEYEDYGHRWGFIDTSGKLVIPYQFEDAGNFTEGLAAVRKGERWGYINKNGDSIIRPIFKGAWAFNYGVARVLTFDNKIGFIDKKGKWAIMPRYENASDFSEGLAIIETEKGFNYIDTDGNIVINGDFEQATNFNDGIAKVKVNGKFVLSPKYQRITIQKNGFIICESGDKIQVKNIKGENIALPKGIRTMYYQPNAILVATSTNPKLIDKKFKTLIDSTFEDISFLIDTFWTAKKNGKIGIFSTKGNTILPCQFSQMYQFSENKIAFQKGGRWGFLDKKFAVITEPQYNLVWSFSNHFARVASYNGYGFINEKGDLVINANFQDAKDFSEGMARVMKK